MTNPEKKPTKTRTPLSMHGLSPEDALRGAMQVPPPPKGKAKKPKARRKA